MICSIFRVVRYSILVIFIPLMLYSCSDILSQNTMADILLEMHWSDAILYGGQPFAVKDSTKIYKAIFERYHTDYHHFENSLRYYSRSSVFVKDIYSKVNKELTSRMSAAQSSLDDYLEELEELRMELVKQWVRNDLPFAAAPWQYYSFYNTPEFIHDEKNCGTPDFSH